MMHSKRYGFGMWDNLLLLGNFLNKPLIGDLYGKTLYKPLTLGKMLKHTCVHVLCRHA